MRNCRSVSPWQPEFKGLGSYTIPKIDVQVAGTLTSRPGPQKAANVQFTAAEIAQTLGRFAVGQRRGPDDRPSTCSTTNEAFYPQITVVDLRVGKLLRFGGACAPTSASTSTTR